MTQPSSTKPILFETASIRPSREDEPFDQRVLPDGIVLRNSSVWRLIWFAYCPSGLLGVVGAYVWNAPDWVYKEKVDISAKVSMDDAPEWQREKTSTWDGSPLKHALQELLAERYKLQAHTILVEGDGFALVLKKSAHNTKLTQAVVGSSPDDTPNVVYLPGGLLQFHHQTMSDFALWLSPFSAGAVKIEQVLPGGMTSRCATGSPFARRQKKPRISGCPVSAGTWGPSV